MYIFTGYGLEGILPDGRVGEIRDRDVLPHFRREDYAGGIKSGVETIAGIIAADAGVALEGGSPGGKSANVPGNEIRTGLIVLVFFLFLLYWLFFRRRRSRRRGSGGYGLFPWIFLGGGSGARGFGGGFSSGGFGGFGGGAAGGGGAGGSW